MESPICPLPDGGCLIETFGWTPGQGIPRLELHLARLARSAKAFGMAYDETEVVALLESLEADDPTRCRLTLSQDGVVKLQLAPMPAPVKSWTIAIADERIDSADDLFRHKTSVRSLYDTARKGLPDGLDELVFLNERGEVCEGTITNILIQTEGRDWLTPSTSSGCLPGTYRQFLLDTGRVKEAVLSLDDLRNANEIRLCNAIRGEFQALLLG